MPEQTQVTEANITQSAANAKADGQAASSAPAPAPAEVKLEFTQAEIDALIEDKVKQATTPLNERLQKLTPYENASKLPEDVRHTATEVRAAERNAKALGRDFKLPSSAVDALSRILDPDQQEKMAKDLAPQPANDVLARAQEKLRGGSREPVISLGNGGGAPKAPMSWAEAQKATNVNDISDAAYEKLVKS